MLDLGVAFSKGGGGGDAVVLNGPAMRAGTCEGGTSSRAQPCIWTQRELVNPRPDPPWDELIMGGVSVEGGKQFWNAVFAFTLGCHE